MKKRRGFKPILVFVLVCIALAACFLRLGTFGSRRADPAIINRTLDSLYAVLPVKSVERITSVASGETLRCDRLQLKQEASLIRANLAISQAVKRVGGEISYGVESFSSKRRWQIVTLGISDGDTLIREVRLEKRLR